MVPLLDQQFVAIFGLKDLLNEVFQNVPSSAVDGSPQNGASNGTLFE